MSKFCPECANPIIECNMPFCPKCGAKIPITSSGVQPYPAQQPATQQPISPSYYNPPASNVPSFSEPVSPERPFYYSNKFYIVMILDIIISGLFGSVVIGQLFFPGNSPTSSLGFSIFFGGIWIINLVLDIYILNNMRSSSHTIDINSCWVKSLFGFLGLLTVISGLYFLIISISMKRAYDARIR